MRQKLSKNMLIVKFHPGMKCLQTFFSFFCPGMKLHPCIFERVFTREISSRDETRKCLLLFTRFRRDEILCRDELIPVKKTGIRYLPGIKKKEKKHE